MADPGKTLVKTVVPATVRAVERPHRDAVADPHADVVGGEHPEPDAEHAPGPSRADHPHCADHPDPEDHPDHRVEEAGAILALSALLPGCGHAVSGTWSHGWLWSAVYLTLALPLAILVYIIFSSFHPAVLFWAWGALILFGALSGLGPAFAWLRRRRSTRGLALAEPGRGTPCPSSRVRLWKVVLQGSVLLLGIALELGLFAASCLRMAQVESSTLEPIAARGHRALVLVSRYVRPVEDDLVLFRGEGVPDARTSCDCPARLGRVVAKPGDAVRAVEGAIWINGIALDLSRTGQRWDIEKAGHAESTKRRLEALLHPFSSPYRPPPEWLPGRFIDWGRTGWGPFVIPRGVLLVIPDGGGESHCASHPGVATTWDGTSLDDDGGPGASPPGATGSAPAHRALLILKGAVLGRVVF